MKKGVGVILIIILIGSILHLSVSRHFCEGKLVASKISLSGNPADCGMRSSGCNSPFSGAKFDIRCCNNIVNSLVITGCYLPSFSGISEYYQYVMYYLYNPSDYQLFASADHDSGYADHDPPGELISSSVRLPMICVFRF
jgi:hypothetical protein